MRFKQFNLNEEAFNVTKHFGYVEPSDIQSMSIPQALKGKNFVAKARTGSGKTMAYLLPIISKLTDEKRPQAIIIVPTVELTTQLDLVLAKIKEVTDVSSVNLVNFDGEMKKLNRQIIITTPGKLAGLINDKKVEFKSSVTQIVIDEADMSLDSGFQQEMADIINFFGMNKQYMFFSATFTVSLRNFLGKNVNDCQFLDDKESYNNNVKHIMLNDRHYDRTEMLIEAIEIENPFLAVIFVTNSKDITKVFDAINTKFPKEAALIHGKMSTPERRKVFKSIANHDVRLVVATDIFARGIDIDDISHVFNYDLPVRNPEFYLHRAGRTGRMNKKGLCISLYNHDDEKYLTLLESMGVKIRQAVIKGGKLTLTNDNDIREKRVSTFENRLQVEARRKLKPPSKKVKPGYKKKRQAAVVREVKKMKREHYKQIMKKKRKETYIRNHQDEE